MIKSLNINNFRGIKTLSIDGLNQFNLLAGKNNCGKTSVLEALFIWANAAYFQNYHFANTLRGLAVQTDSFYNFFYGASLENSISIETSDAVAKKRKIEITGENPKGISITDIEPKITTTITENDASPKIYLYQPGGREDARGNDISILPNQYYSIYDGTLPQKLTGIIVNKQKDSLIKTLKNLDPSIQDFQMVNGNLIMFDIGKPQLIRYEIMGDGIKKMTSLLASIVAAKNGVLLIDEFENGLHHSSMKILWNALFKSCLENNVQVFATTHSYECISSFCNALDEIQTGDASVIRIEKNSDLHSVVNMNKEDLETLLNNNWEIR